MGWHMVLKWSRIRFTELQREILSHFLRVARKDLEGNSGVGLCAGAFLTSKTSVPACTFSYASECVGMAPDVQPGAGSCLFAHPLFLGRFLSCREGRMPRSYLLAHRFLWRRFLFLSAWEEFWRFFFPIYFFVTRAK